MAEERRLNISLVIDEIARDIKDLQEGSILINYRSEYNEGFIYAGFLLDDNIVINKTKDGITTYATGLTDLEADWSNRYNLTYI